MQEYYDYNDLNKRIGLLYKVSGNFKEFIPNERITTTLKDNPVKDNRRVIEISFGVEEFTDDQKETFQIQTNQIIDNLANLKDNTKNKLTLNGKNGNLVEQYINSNLPLQLITDLDNLNKHGSPLTRPYRTGYEPKITNIRKESRYTFFFGWLNYLKDSRIYLDADVVNQNEEVIFGLKKLITSSIVLWENFYLQNLPEESIKIKENRKKAIELKKEFEEFKELENLAMKLRRENTNWIPIDSTRIEKGMLVSCLTNNHKKLISGGLVVNKISNEENSESIIIYNLFDLGQTQKVEANKYSWVLFNHPNPELNSKFYNYYNKLDEMRKLAIEGKFIQFDKRF